MQGEEERPPEDTRDARVSLVRIIREGEKRKCKGPEVGACLECSKRRNMSGVAGEIWDRA